MSRLRATTGISLALLLVLIAGAAASGAPTQEPHGHRRNSGSLDLVGRSSRSNGSAASSRSSGIDLSVHADAARYFETRFDELGRSIFLNASYDGGWDQHPRSGSWSGVQDRSRTQTLNAQQRTRS